MNAMKRTCKLTRILVVALVLQFFIRLRFPEHVLLGFMLVIYFCEYVKWSNGKIKE